MTQSALQLVQPAPSADDASLLTRARAGDERAVDLLVGRYLNDVYAVTARMLSDRDLAQDAAQDALVSAVKGLARFRGDASFRTWIMRIAMNSARSVARRSTRRREVSLEVVAESAADGTDVAIQAARHDEASRALALLEKLPDKQRMAVTLRVQQGLSYQEISAVIGCAEGAARVNYHLGVKRLREMMK